MHVDDLRVLYAYNCWMSDRILDAGSRVAPGQFTAPTDLTPRNLRDTLVHILDVEWSWRERARGAPEEVWRAEITPAGFPDVAALRSRWEAESAIMRDYLDGLNDEDVGRPFRWQRTGRYRSGRSCSTRSTTGHWRGLRPPCY